MAASTLRRRPWCLILASVAVVNLPIIKFSVDWWNTRHRPASIMLTGAPLIYPGMLLPLFVAANFHFLLFAAIVVAQLCAAVMKGRVRGVAPALANAESAEAARLFVWPNRDMDEVWYILAVYAAGVLRPLSRSLGASVSLTHAEASLAAFDPRLSRTGKHGGRS